MRRSTLVVAVMMMVVACGSDADAGTPGEIVGITAQVSMDEAQSGNIENLAYLGTVVVRIEGVGEVTAECDKEYVGEIGGAPSFSVDEISGGIVATITITVDPPQAALLVQDGAGGWEVIEILE